MKKKILSLLLCLSVFISLFVPAGLVAAQTGDTAKITVNYVYEKNNAMARSRIPPRCRPASHFATIALPEILNYSITARAPRAAGRRFAGFGKSSSEH